MTFAPCSNQYFASSTQLSQQASRKLSSASICFIQSSCVHHLFSSVPKYVCVSVLLYSSLSMSVFQCSYVCVPVLLCLWSSAPMSVFLYSYICDSVLLQCSYSCVPVLLKSSSAPMFVFLCSYIHVFLCSYVPVLLCLCSSDPMSTFQLFYVCVLTGTLQKYWNTHIGALKQKHRSTGTWITGTWITEIWNTGAWNTEIWNTRGKGVNWFMESITILIPSPRFAWGGLWC